MNAFLNLPFEVRLLLVAFCGMLMGTQVNRAIYRLAWNRRDIGPFSPKPQDGPPRHWFDFVPVLGWLSISREAKIHGTAFWIRPMLIEIGLGVGLATLYQWETTTFLLPPPPLFVPVDAAKDALQAATHAMFYSHALLICLMAAATFIDFDEKLIPDAVTLPGTLIGLLIAGFLPAAALPILVFGGNESVRLTLISPSMNWPAWLSRGGGLAIGEACFLAWVLAIAPKVWWTRSGLRKAILLLVASMRRYACNRYWAALTGAGLAFVAGVYLFAPDVYWKSLLSALLGMVFGGAIVWAVRLIGSFVLGKEAMGFGDVTLMAMIGAFLGWQASLIVFFLAPFAGVIVSVVRWLTTGDKEIAYGPFLCFAALFLIIRWATLWEGWGREVFALGWWVPAFFAICLVLMGLMLTAYRAFLSLRER